MAERKYVMRGAIVLVFILAVWVLYVSSKQIERNRRIEKEVTLLQTEAEKIRRENQTLSEKISYFSSMDFREQEAKEKLGMKKTNEAVVIIKQRPVQEEEKKNESAEEKRTFMKNEEPSLPHYRKWWELFFKGD